MILALAQALIPVALALTVAYLMTGRQSLFKAAQGATAAAALGHVAWMLHFGAAFKQCVLLDPWGVTSMMVAAVLAGALFASVHFKTPRLLIGALSITTGAVVIARLMLPDAGSFSLTMDWVLAFHIFLMAMGIASLSIGFVTCLLIVIRSRGLKSKRWDQEESVNWPSLEKMDRLFVISVTLGAALFALGIATGISAAAGESLKVAWYLDPKVSLSLLGFAFYGAVGYLRKKKGFCTRQVAVFSILGFLCLILGFFSGVLHLGFHKF